MFGVLAAERIDEHKRGVVAALTTCQYQFNLEGCPAQMGRWRHVNALPKCREIIASYRVSILSTDSSALKPLPRNFRPAPADVL